MTQRYILVGAHAGKTITLGGHQFIDGAFTFGADADGVMPSDQDKARKGNLLSKLYQAYPEDSAELAAAEGRLEKNEAPPGELDVGEREKQEQEERPPVGTTAASERAIKGAIRTAITQLDPANDEHWTDGGLPSVAAVRELSGNKDVGRADIASLAPKLTREEATKLAADPLD